MNKVCFTRQLCSICLQSFSPLKLKRVRNISICAQCLKLIAERQDEWRKVAEHPKTINPEESETPNEAGILKVISREGSPFIEDIKAASGAFSKGFIAIVIARVAAYFGGSILFASDEIWLAMLNGAMLADIITWFIFNILQMPFVGMGFASEFIIYGGFMSYLAGTDKLIMLSSPLQGEPMALAMLVFMFVGIFKTIFWATGLFCTGKAWGE
jgi:hypothetical protein